VRLNQSLKCYRLTMPATHAGARPTRDGRHAAGSRRGLCWSVERAQNMFEVCIAPRGVLAANAIAKLENHRNRTANKISNRLATGSGLTTEAER